MKGQNEKFKSSFRSKKLETGRVLKGLYFLTIILSEILIVISRRNFMFFGMELKLSFNYFIPVLLIYCLILSLLMRGKVPAIKDLSILHFIYIILLWLMVVCFSTFVTSLFYSEPFNYFFQNILNLSKWVSNILFLLVGLIFIKWDEDDLKFLFRLLILSSISVSIYIAVKYNLINNYFQLNRGIAYVFWEDTAKNEIPEILGLISVIIFSITLQINNILRKMILFFLCIFIIIVMLSFFSRESYVSIFVSFIALIFLKKTRRPIKVVLIVIFLLTTALFLKTKFGSSILWAIAELKNNPQLATAFRIERWSTACKIIIEHPILGVGFWNFGYFAILKGYQGTAAHNAFLQSLVVAGLPGLIIFLYFIFYLLKNLLKSLKSSSTSFSKAFAMGMLSFTFGYLFSALFSDHFFTFYYFNYIFFGILAVIIGACRNRKGEIKALKVSFMSGFSNETLIWRK